MADILSLSKARKERARALKEQRASENRAKFGLSKAERRRQEAERKRVERTVEAHQRGGDTEGDPSPSDNLTER